MDINKEVLKNASECLKCIAHPVRLQILALLEKEARNVSEIVEALNIPQSLTSEHLRLMEAKGILNGNRQGRKVFYSMAMPELKNILKCIKSKGLTRQ